MHARSRPVSAMRSTIPQPVAASAVYFRLALAHLAIELARRPEPGIVAPRHSRRPAERAHPVHRARHLRRGRLADSSGLLRPGHGGPPISHRANIVPRTEPVRRRRLGAIGFTRAATASPGRPERNGGLGGHLGAPSIIKTPR